MISIDVALGAHSYPIHIGSGLIDDPRQFTQAINGRDTAIVTNDIVAPLYAERVKRALEAAGKRVCLIVLPDGEAHKNVATIDRIYTALLTAQYGRRTTLIALGGGVIGDMTGFAAATYMRGVDFIQVPTTLLALVDSSVGGKTGVNHPLGKNMIGAFHQPRAVIADLSTLATLPDRELHAGVAEVIKHGLVADADLFAWCESHIDHLLARDVDAITHVVRRSCEIKADVVRRDEREADVRAILNFGHTFGHAIEAGMGYGAWLHGEAVGAGMVMAADLSMRLGYLSATDVERVRALVGRAQLPVQPPKLGAQRFIELMSVDKKVVDDGVKYVVLKRLGEAAMQLVPPPIVIQTLNAFGQ